MRSLRKRLVSAYLIILPLCLSSALAEESAPTLQEALAEGKRLLDAGDAKAASDVCTRILAVNPREIDALIYRGLASVPLGDKVTCFADLNAALELRPDDAKVWTIRGSAHAMFRHWNQAECDFREALRLDSTNILARIGRAEAFAELGEFGRSVWESHLGLREDPLNTKLLDRRGTSRMEAGDPRGAIEDLSRSIEIGGVSAERLTNRGNARLTLDDLTGALDDLQEAVRCSPTNAWARVSLAWGQLLAGDLRSAINEAKKSLELSPGYPDAVYTLALANHSLGLNGEALAYLDVLRSIEDESVSGEAEILQWSVLRRLGKSALADARLLEFVEALTAEDKDRWFRVAGKYLLGMATQEDLFEEGSRRPTRSADLHVAWWLHGLRCVELGQTKHAYSAFEQCAASAPAHAVERTMARQELKRLEGTPLK